MPKLQNGSKPDSNPHSLDCESAILPLAVKVSQEVTNKNTIDSFCPSLEFKSEFHALST